MDIQQLLQSMAERVSASASVKNVYGDPAYADVRKELTAELERLRKELKDNEG